LFEWQERVIDGMLGVTEDGRWASTEDGLDVARQNGKGVILQAVELYCLFVLGFKVVMHTAHEFPTAQEHQLRLEDIIRNCPELHSRVKERGGYMHANGRESINLKSGERLLFKARTTGGGRGYSGWLLTWDEAMDIPDSVVGAQMPMLRACPSPFGPKVIFAGSAVDQEVHRNGVNFAMIRERGIAQSPRMSWHEWSAGFDHPSELTEDLMRDKALWLAANPSIVDGLVSESYMADEIERMPSRVGAVELLGVGDWPRTDGFEDTVIQLEDWDALEDQKSELQEPWCLAFDVSPERRTSIALAGRNQDDRFHVEIQECRPGTSWAVARIVEIVEAGMPEIVVCDSVGPASSLLVALKDAGVKVETVNSTEHGQACGRLVDMVNDGTLAHLGSSELRDAIRGSKVRQLGDAWAWSRKSSSVDISPLVAATLALGAAAGVGIGEVAIF
jgi:predicted Fe-Mo cluster-binding NifX family protein